MLNLYPYAPGHLMVCPYRHIADYTETTDDEAAEMADLTRQAMRVVRSVSGADGFNIGMNQGHIAGAGIAAHLHQHVVPRWLGDQNFMPIIGRTKTLPELLGGHPGPAGRGLGLSRQRFLLVRLFIELAPLLEAASRFSARFSLMDFPVFAVLLCRGDLSLMGFLWSVA